MPAINPLDYLGQSWTLWQPLASSGALHIVSGVEKISAHIISVLLLRPGEDLMHPDLPMAPDLFDPLSTVNAYYWAYHTEQKIRKFVSGLDQLKVVVEGVDENYIPDPYNRLHATIQFTPLYYPDPNALTFGWYEYRGAIADPSSGIEPFLDSIYLNNAKHPRFNGLQDLSG